MQTVPCLHLCIYLVFLLLQLTISHWYLDLYMHLTQNICAPAQIRKNYLHNKITNYSFYVLASPKKSGKAVVYKFRCNWINYLRKKLKI